MKLLFVSNVYPNVINPTKGTFNAALTRALAASHSVHIVSPISWLEAFTARFRRKLRVPAKEAVLGERLTAEFPLYYYPPKVLRSHYGEFMEWSVAHRLDSAIQRQKPDAVVSYWAHPDGEVALNAARRAGIPAISMVGGSDVLLLTRNGARREAILNVLRRSDAVVTVSRDIAENLQRDGIEAGKLHVVYRGVDRDRFCPGDKAAARARLGVPFDRKILIAVGRLVPVKGFDVLVDACRHLKASRVKFQCYILGGGELQGALARQIRELGLQDEVTLAGGQPQQQLADWYRAADLTVLSSHSEGVPNVLLESLCCGTPFVATRVGGVPEIADRRLHTLVAPNDAVALADAISDRLTAAADQSGLNQPPRWLPGSWKDSADALTEIIKQCQSGRNLRSATSLECGEEESLAADREFAAATATGSHILQDMY